MKRSPYKTAARAGSATVILLLALQASATAAERSLRLGGTLGLLPVASMAESSPGGNTGDAFDGITIVRLADENAAIAIAGDYRRGYRGHPLYLVTFVSPRGTYASLTGASKACVAWSAAGGSEGKSITFGIEMDDYEGRPGSPWCQPFTVTRQGDATVRLTADNEVMAFGLKGQGESRRFATDGVHEVLARIPLDVMDVGQAASVRHAIHGVQLGPIASEDGPTQVKVSNEPLRRTVRVRVDAGPGQSAHTLNGAAAPAGLTGWGADYLIALWSQERLNPGVASDELNGRYIERLGPPTAAVNDRRKQQGGMWWLYDSAGRLIESDRPVANSCAALFDQWRGTTLWTFNQDLGPWGCSVVVRLQHNAGNYPTVKEAARETHPALKPPAGGHPVNQLREEMAAGNAMAYRHFMERLVELAAARDALGVDASAGRSEPVVPQARTAAPEPAAAAETASGGGDSGPGGTPEAVVAEPPSSCTVTINATRRGCERPYPQRACTYDLEGTALVGFKLVDGVLQEPSVVESTVQLFGRAAIAVLKDRSDALLAQWWPGVDDASDLRCLVEFRFLP